MILDELDVPQERFAAGTGWEIKEIGACREDVCVPLPAGALHDGMVSVPVVAERLRMPVLHDEAQGKFSLGPASLNGRVLSSARAPELTLPDLDGNPFSLSSLLGQKVLLVAWASW